jgi:transposase
VHSKGVWARIIGVDRSVVIEGVDIDEEAGEVVMACRSRANAARRCGHCSRRSGRYDQGEGRRRGVPWTPGR